MTDDLLEDPADIRTDDPRLAFDAVAATAASCAPATPPPWFDLRQEVLSVDVMTDLCMTIGRFGDHITPTRRVALRQLLTCLVEQALGVNTGRYAYGLPCGAGKTQAIVALMVSIHKLGLPISIAVSASTIKALCLIKRDLLQRGVPEQMVGLRHGKSLPELSGELAGESIPPEAMANTGDDDRQFMLVSHAHVRGGQRGAIFAEHKGKPRDLLIWDESFFSAKAGALSLRELEQALRALAVDIPRGTPLHAFLATAIERIKGDTEAQRKGAGPAVLDLLSGTELDTAKHQASTITRRGKIAAAAFEAIDDLLSLAERDLSVALTGNGADSDALIHYTVAVSPAWQNIAVLDASVAIRLLAKGDSVTDRTTDEMRECRTYEKVVVRQQRIAAGKTTQRSNVAKVAQAVAAILGDLRSQHPEWRILLVTFKDTKAKLLAALHKEGIGPDAHVGGKPRISVLTWGQETSTNAYSDHEAVILAGVLRRSCSELAASSAGEAGDILHRDGASGLRELQVSESAHNTLQAIHRGQCRKTDPEGKALPMEVYIIDNEAGLRDVLMPVLPGVTWDISTPVDVDSRTHAAMVAVVSYLTGLPATVRSVSIRKLKEAVAATSGIALGDDQWDEAIDRAMDGRRLLAGLTHPADQAWHRVRRRRSVER